MTCARDPRAGISGLLAGAGFVVAIWLIAASRWIVTDTVVPWDSKNQFYAFFRFLAASVHSGHRRSGIRITTAAIRPWPTRSR